MSKKIYQNVYIFFSQYPVLFWKIYLILLLFAI